MMRYNKALEYLQCRFADALASLDPRFDQRAVEQLMQRDNFMPYVERFLTRVWGPSPGAAAPTLLLIASAQLQQQPSSPTATSGGAASGSTADAGGTIGSSGGTLTLEGTVTFSGTNTLLADGTTSR